MPRCHVSILTHEGFGSHEDLEPARDVRRACGGLGVSISAQAPTVMTLECRRWKCKSNQLEKKRGGQGKLQVWQDQGFEQRHQGSGPLSVPSSAGTSLATSDRGLPFPTSRKDSGHPPSVPGAVGTGTLITRHGEERTGPHIRPCRVDSQEQRPLGPSRGAGLGRGVLWVWTSKTNRCPLLSRHQLSPAKQCHLAC